MALIHSWASALVFGIIVDPRVIQLIDLVLQLFFPISVSQMDNFQGSCLVLPFLDHFLRFKDSLIASCKAIT